MLFVICVTIAVVVIVYGLLLLHAHWKSNPDNIKKYKTTNPFITSATLIAAHRIGGGDAPEESILALNKCLEGDNLPDILEMDLHITKDGHLVLLHDDTLDRTTDSQYVFGKSGLRPEDMTLKELKTLNIGACFMDEEGNMPYKDLHGEDVPDYLRIVTVEEFLSITEEKENLKYIIEIKNKGYDGKKALDILYSLLEERNLLDRVIFGTFNKEITEYASSKYPKLVRSASVKEVLEFYISALLNGKDYTPPFSVLQVFYGKQYFKYGINLATSRVINYAHSHNMAIQYWTVNDKRDIEYLMSVGADAVMTDYVERAFEVRNNL